MLLALAAERSRTVVCGLLLGPTHNRVALTVNMVAARYQPLTGCQGATNLARRSDKASGQRHQRFGGWVLLVAVGTWALPQLRSSTVVPTENPGLEAG